ncbi:MAG: imidazolonepropionase [Anaerolineales bacterium]|nr:imidazolonepropionase [Anaerolineales bacterium]
MQVDLIIHSTSQVVTCHHSRAPKRGATMQDAGVIEGGAIAIADGIIVDVGPSAAIRANYTAGREVDATGLAVCPGFVDPHTHLVYAGDRVAEFERKMQGVPYLDILRSGGGILSTMRATRAATVEELTVTAQHRLRQMEQLGTTTVEIKTGYGLDTRTECNLLAAIDALAGREPADIVPTFLGAHAVPPEFAGNADGYVALIEDEMLPAAAEWHAASRLAGKPFYCDAFCEANVFDAAQTRTVLEAARTLDFPLKLHADEFVSLGGVSLAVALGATSVDHLDVTPDFDRAVLAASPTMAVVLPAVNFHLGSTHFADARRLIDEGAALAIATDANPGSAPCLSMPFIMALACRYQKLTPAEALNAATINAAYAIGLGDQVGSLAPGKQADLLILDAPDFRHLVYWFGHNLVRNVIKRGQFIV